MSTSPQSHYLEVPPAERNAVVDALYRFGAGQDLRDPGLFESAFSRDATVDFTGPAQRLGATIPVFKGRTAICELILGTTAALHTTHSVSNPRITAYDGRRATLFALVEAQHLPRSDPSRHLLLKNLYFVDLSKEEARWEIDSMRIENVWMTGDPAVLFPPKAD